MFVSGTETGFGNGSYASIVGGQWGANNVGVGRFINARTMPILVDPQYPNNPASRVVGVRYLDARNPAPINLRQPSMPAAGYRDESTAIRRHGEKGFVWLRAAAEGVTNIGYESGLLQTQVSPADQALNIRCTTDTKPLWVVTTPSDIPDESTDGCYILYFGDNEVNDYIGNRFLNVGRWGTYDEVQAGTADVSRVSQVALFRWGSIVGLSSPMPGLGEPADSYDSNDVLFNPSNVIVTDDWTTVPYQTGNVMTHTPASMLAGLGDPCRLAGYYESEIMAELAAGHRPDNGKWRMPGRGEWMSFLNLAENGTTSVPIEVGENYYKGTMNYEGVTVFEPSLVQGTRWYDAASSWSGLGFTRFPNARISANGAANTNATLPVPGNRYGENGNMRGKGIYAFWMTVAANNETHCYRVHLNDWVDGEALGLTTKNSVFSVRCVPQ